MRTATVIAAAEPTAAAAPRTAPATLRLFDDRDRFVDGAGVLGGDELFPPRLAALREGGGEFCPPRLAALFDGGADFFPPRLAAAREGGDVRARELAPAFFAPVLFEPDADVRFVVRLFELPVLRAVLLLREETGLFDADFFDADFLEADFFEADFFEADFLGADFFDEPLEDARFEVDFFDEDRLFADDFFAPALLLPLARFVPLDLAAMAWALRRLCRWRQDTSSG